MTPNSEPFRSALKEHLLWLSFFLLCVAATVCAFGCAQNTATPTTQDIPQQQETATVTEQATAAQGTDIVINISNLADPTNAGGVSWTLPNTNGLHNEYVAAAEADPLRTNAGFVQHGFSITINTGDTTPSQTGTTTGTATQTAAQTSYPTVSATQDIRPRLALDLPVGIALPGGIADVAGSAGSGEGTVALEKQSENLLRWAEIKQAEADQLAAYAALIDSVLGNADADATTNGAGNGG